MLSRKGIKFQKITQNRGQSSQNSWTLAIVKANGSKERIEFQKQQLTEILVSHLEESLDTSSRRRRRWGRPGAPPGSVVGSDPLDFGVGEGQDGANGLQHVVPRGRVRAEHVVEDHVLEVLEVGALLRRHPLQPPDEVSETFQLVGVAFLFGTETHLWGKRELWHVVLSEQFKPCTSCWKANWWVWSVWVIPSLSFGYLISNNLHLQLPCQLWEAREVWQEESGLKGVWKKLMGLIKLTNTSKLLSSGCSQAVNYTTHNQEVKG